MRPVLPQAKANTASAIALVVIAAICLAVIIIVPASVVGTRDENQRVGPSHCHLLLRTGFSKHTIWCLYGGVKRRRGSRAADVTAHVINCRWG